VLPSVVGRTILAIALAILVSWPEFFSFLGNMSFLNVSIFLWTILIIFLVWAVSLVPLMAVRVSNNYVLRDDGLEIRTGIITSKSFVVAPAGFSDLEVTRSVTDRVLGTGDIVVRTQGDTDIVIKKVKNPLKVADRIREVMARPSVRIERTGTNQGELA
jgi:uncharacterized membrane protein YdbT with pleckstrin-like domain